jgi:RNA recognition motif-containing protein
MKNLYVGNLPHSTPETELRNIFEAHGAVEKSLSSPTGIRAALEVSDSSK